MMFVFREYETEIADDVLVWDWQDLGTPPDPWIAIRGGHGEFELESIDILNPDILVNGEPPIFEMDQFGF